MDTIADPVRYLAQEIHRVTYPYDPGLVAVVMENQLDFNRHRFDIIVENYYENDFCVYIDRDDIIDSERPLAILLSEQVVDQILKLPIAERPSNVILGEN